MKKLPKVLMHKKSGKGELHDDSLLQGGVHVSAPKAQKLKVKVSPKFSHPVGKD